MLTTSIAFSRANDVVKHLQSAMTAAYNTSTAVGLIEGFDDADREDKIAMFVRFSSAEQKINDDFNGDFAGKFIQRDNFD